MSHEIRRRTKKSRKAKIWN